MSRLEQLLEGVEVEWTVLGNNSFIEIANNGRKPVKSDLRLAGEIPYYGANNIQDYVEGFTHNGIYVLIAEDGTQSIENYSIQWATGKFWANNHVHVLSGKGKLDSRFLYHYLKQVNFIPFLSGGGRAKLTKGELEKIPIPIPPLSIQAEIVRILDTFTELTTELTAELTARKKQYNFYREQLLSFEDGEVEWKTLGEVFNMRAGQYISASNINSKKDDSFLFPCYGGNGVRGFVKKYSHDGAYVLIGRQGALCGNVQRFKGKFYATEHAVVVTPNDFMNIDYAFYYLTIMNLNQYASKSAQPGLAIGNLSSLKIPIPSLEEQARIVSILDKFDILTNSISEGLPKEIELRKKQYEYYRDMLLTFPKKETA